jgi:hypothetical protein
MKYSHNIRIKDLAEKSGVDEKTIHARITALKISKKNIQLRGCCKVATIRKCDAERIISYGKHVFKNKYVKIQIVEMHIEEYSGRKICEIMSLPKKLVSNTINYYKETGCVLVESKLNRMI